MRATPQPSSSPTPTWDEGSGEESDLTARTPGHASHGTPAVSGDAASSVETFTLGTPSLGSQPSAGMAAPSPPTERVGRVDPRATTYPRKPSRYLAPEIAESVKRAKLRTGASWRRIAKHIGVSHSHLVLIAQGKRVPSTTVADAMSKLPFEPGEFDALMEAAAFGVVRDRR